MLGDTTAPYHDVSLGYTSGTTVTFKLAHVLQPLRAQSPSPVTVTNTETLPQSMDGFTICRG